jgi:hypothetical protein
MVGRPFLAQKPLPFWRTESRSQRGTVSEIQYWSPSHLLAYWREHAIEIEAYAQPAAAAFRRAADHLEEVLQCANTEPLTLEQAASESGYSVDHLARLIRQGRIPNAGRKNAPRVVRSDLPHKRQVDGLPARGECLHLVGADPRQVARALVTASKEKAV